MTDFEWFPKTSSEWASWVQAIFSVVAIVAAWWIASYQSRQATFERATSTFGRAFRQRAAVRHQLRNLRIYIELMFSNVPGQQGSDAGVFEVSAGRVRRIELLSLDKATETNLTVTEITDLSDAQLYIDEIVGVDEDPFAMTGRARQHYQKLVDIHDRFDQAYSRDLTEGPPVEPEWWKLW